jgi:hypothetical protein
MLTRQNPTEFAWRVHGALEAWTAKVDMKASVLLGFQVGLAILIVTAPGLGSGPAEAATVLLVGGMGGATATILPALGPARRLRREYRRHLIYFGHLRLWQPAELAHRLCRLSDGEELQALAAQLVRMSRLNWRKHRLLQASGTLTLLSMFVMMVAVAVHRGL